MATNRSCSDASAVHRYRRLKPTEGEVTKRREREPNSFSPVRNCASSYPPHPTPGRAEEVCAARRRVAVTPAVEMSLFVVRCRFQEAAAARGSEIGHVIQSEATSRGAGRHWSVRTVRTHGVNHDIFATSLPNAQKQSLNSSPS